MLEDVTFWSYAVIIALSAYNFGVFCWWWSKVDSARPFYVYMTLLLAGTLVRTIGDVVRLYEVYYVLSDNVEREICRHPPWWDLRLLGIIVSLLCISVHVTLRIYKRIGGE